jgi:hypothetical protein
MLKPTTNYRFSESDLQFVLELAKCGHVHLLSNQVSMIDVRSSGNRPNFTFKEYGITDMVGCEGLKMPENWVIEGIYTDDNSLNITFGVLPIK